MLLNNLSINHSSIWYSHPRF